MCILILYMYVIHICLYYIYYHERGRNLGLALAKLDTDFHFEKDELLNGFGNRNKPKSKPPSFVFDPLEFSFLDSLCMGV